MVCDPARGALLSYNQAENEALDEAVTSVTCLWVAWTSQGAQGVSVFRQCSI